MKNYEVIIVGAGPVGSHLACRLAQAGVEVALLEQKKEPVGKPACTGIISAECVKTYFPDSEILIKPLNKGILHSANGEKIVINGTKPKAFLIDRKRLEMNQWERAKKSGVYLINGLRVKNISTTTDNVLVEAEESNQTLTGKLVILTTGFDPKLTEKIGLGLIKDQVLGAQAEVISEEEELQIFFNQDFAPGFFGWLVPSKNGKALVGLLSRKNTSKNFSKFTSYLQNIGKISSFTSPIHFGKIPLSPLAKTYGNRIIAVGDSAGQVKPTTGGGIYFGLKCADLAHKVILEALKNNDFSESFLSQYEHGWKKIIGKEINQGIRARRILESLDDKKISLIFSLINKNNLLERLLNKDDLSFDWHSRILKRLIKELPLACLL